MRIAVGADHAGMPLNETAIAELCRLGHEVVDLGTHESSKPDDYPDYAAAVAEEVTSGHCERALLICGSGVGVSVAANKFPEIRAAMCHDIYSAHQGVEHDNMNILCLGARVVGPRPMLDLVRAFWQHALPAKSAIAGDWGKSRLERRFCGEQRAAVSQGGARQRRD